MTDEEIRKMLLDVKESFEKVKKLIDSLPCKNCSHNPANRDKETGAV
jgi:hypothetical protein